MKARLHGFLTACILTILFGCDSQRDISPPIVTITFPADGAPIEQPVNIIAEVADDSGPPKQVEFLVDGEPLATDDSPPHEYFWDASAWADDKDHSIQVRALDEADNVGSDQITITVVKPRPRISLLSDGGGSEQFQIILLVEEELYVDRILVVETHAGEMDELDERPVDKTFQNLDRIVLPSENEFYECVSGNWDIKIFGETRVGFRVLFKWELRVTKFVCPG